MNKPIDRIKCSWCGRFISMAALENKEAKVEFTPDSECSYESIEYICSKCVEKFDE